MHSENKKPDRGGESGFKAIADELNQPLFAIAVNADAVIRMLENLPGNTGAMRAALADIAQDAIRVSRLIAMAQRLMAGIDAPSDQDAAATRGLHGRRPGQ